MKNMWFTSDTHYFHNNILKFTDRPYLTVEEMNEDFIEWNNKNVKDNDDFYHLGDFSFGSFEQTLDVVKRLKGKKHLLLGNHCHVMRDNRSTFRDYFESIQDLREVSLGKKKKIILCHYPMRSWNASNYGSFHLHGHTHGSMEPYGKSVDVGIDSQFITGKYEGRPFHLDEIEKFMETREIAKDYGD